MPGHSHSGPLCLRSARRHTERHLTPSWPAKPRLDLPTPLTAFSPGPEAPAFPGLLEIRASELCVCARAHACACVHTCACVCGHRPAHTGWASGHYCEVLHQDHHIKPKSSCRTVQNSGIPPELNKIHRSQHIKWKKYMPYTHFYILSLLLICFIFVHRHLRRTNFEMENATLQIVLSRK